MIWAFRLSGPWPPVPWQAFVALGAGLVLAAPVAWVLTGGPGPGVVGLGVTAAVVTIGLGLLAVGLFRRRRKRHLG